MTIKLINKEEIYFVVKDAVLSPEDRYFRNMVGTKNSIRTILEDLISKYYAQIDKYKNSFSDDECDIMIKELKEKINNICFTFIYCIENLVNQVRTEENSLDLARSYLKR